MVFLLSTRQRSKMVAIVLIMAIILGVGVVMNLPNKKTTSETFTTEKIFITDQIGSEILPLIEQRQVEIKQHNN